MKNYTGLLSVAIVSGGLMANLPARADTAYHRVYHEPVTSTDAFSKLDKYQNNALTPEEFNNGGNTVAFNAVDTNHDGFVTRDEFYEYNRTAAYVQNPAQLTLIQPAAGGSYYVSTECTFTDNSYCETRPY